MSQCMWPCLHVDMRAYGVRMGVDVGGVDTKGRPIVGSKKEHIKKGYIFIK